MSKRVIIPVVLLVLIAATLVVSLTGCGKSKKEVAQEKCYAVQKSIDAAMKAYKKATGQYPATLADFKNVKYLKWVVSPCPSGGKWTLIPGDPPQVKCSIHGFYK